MRGVVLSHHPPDVVTVGCGHGQFTVHVDRTGAGGGVAEPDGALFANGMDQCAARHARCDHRLHDLLPDEGVGAARVEDDRYPGCRKGHQIGDDAGLHITGDGTGHRAVDVQEEGKGRGRRRVGAKGGSGGIRGRSSHGSIVSAAARAAPQADASAPHVTHGYCLATTSVRDPIHIP